MNQDDPFAGVASAPTSADPFASFATAPERVIDPTTQALYQIQSKVTPGAQSSVKAHRLETIQEESPTLSALMPSTAQAMADGQSYGGRLWGSTKDLLTSPFRVAAGAGLALGEMPGAIQETWNGFSRGIESVPQARMPFRHTMGLLGALRAFPDAMVPAAESFMQGLRSPSEAAASVEGQGPEWAQQLLNPQVYAGMAEDPLTGASAMIPAMAGSRLGAFMGRLAEGGIGSAMSYGRNVADRLAAGDAAPFTESGSQVAADAAPLALAFLPGAASRLGGKLVTGSQNMFRKMINPAPMKNGGEEVKGLLQALDAGLLPKLAGWNLTAGGAGSRFVQETLPAIGSEYPEALALADASGQTVNANDVLRETVDRLAESIASRREIMAPRDAGKAAYWAGDYLTAPLDIPGAKAGMFGKPPAGAVANEVTLVPSQAHRTKSILAQLAFSRDPSETTPLYARLLALKYASRALGTRLGEISPEYAELNARAAPYYAAEDAMIRAANTGGNRNFLSLGTLMHPLSALQEMPLVSRAAWEAGKGLGRLGGTEAAMPALYPIATEEGRR